MMNARQQLGVGLVEVLVALILLAVGVLGYTALQLRAVDATSEALTRSQATLILRGLTESMRANSNAQANYPDAIKAYVGVADPKASPSCLNTACTSSDIAKYDAFMAAKSASGIGVKITMTECPGVKSVKRQCLFAAWDETYAKLSSTDYSSCMDSNGIYAARAKCLMMEAY